jgi:hypothetical protein
MKKIILATVIATGFAMGLNSCKKEEKTEAPKVDVRDASVGRYAGSFVQTIDGEQTTDTATFILEKGDNNTIIIRDASDANTFIRTASVEANGNDYSALIPSQSVRFGTESFTVQGDGSSSFFQCRYNNESKRLNFRIKWTDDGQEVVNSYEGTRR